MSTLHLWKQKRSIVTSFSLCRRKLHIGLYSPGPKLYVFTLCNLHDLNCGFLLSSCLFSVSLNDLFLTFPPSKTLRCGGRTQAQSLTLTLWRITFSLKVSTDCLVLQNPTTCFHLPPHFPVSSSCSTHLFYILHSFPPPYVLCLFSFHCLALLFSSLLFFLLSLSPSCGCASERASRLTRQQSQQSVHSQAQSVSSLASASDLWDKSLSVCSSSSALQSQDRGSQSSVRKM